jgi:hypothetical protein
MSTPLIQILVAITKGASVPTSSGAAFASTSVVITDSTGVAQAPVLLTGKELPTPWAFITSVAPGNGTAVATDLDVNGVVLGTVTQTFTEAGSPPTFLPTSAIAITPVVPAATPAAVKS